MLIRFYIKNFLSFNERTEFNMVSGSYKRHDDHLISLSDSKILKYSSIYGPNSCGKSNFISSLSTLNGIVTSGTKDKKETLPYSPYKLDPENETKPTSFEIDFMIENITFSYFIEYNKHVISEEWLYILKNDSNEMVFERTTDSATQKNSLKFNPKMFLSDEISLRTKIYEDDLRSNQPFIFEGNNKSLKFIKDAYNWFDKKLFVLTPDIAVKGLVTSLVANKEFRELFDKFIYNASLDLDKVDIKENGLLEYFSNDPESTQKELIETVLRSEDSYDWKNDSGTFLGAYRKENNLLIGELELLHLNKEKNFINLGLYAESRGTIRLLHLLPTLINISFKNIVLVMDELETSIHPLLTEYLLKFIFKNNSNSSGQLIFSTHMTNLLDLDIFRQDEIWLFSKNADKSTSISPLSEFKVRFDLDIQRKYLEGHFGAIPCLKNI